MENTPVFSSRRGRNFLLHNLEESDVVFGTKGNGRNEIFLKVLESHSEQYVQLSKFQKMGLIQNIIRDWKGNFYIMNSKTNDLCLAKKKDQDLSTTDSSSRKLYTSVRRMMNYVNSKIQRQPYHPQRCESFGSSALNHRTSTAGSMIQASHIPATNSILTKKEHEQKSRGNALVLHAEVANLAAKEKDLTVMTATDYISKNQVTLPNPESTFMNFPCTPTSMNISTPKRSAMLVTPEPSPRAMLQNPLPMSPIPFSKPVFPQSNTALIASSLPLSPLPLTTVACKHDGSNCYLKPKASTATATIAARNTKIKKLLHATDNTIIDLEESAILALTSLGYLSSVMSS